MISLGKTNCDDPSLLSAVMIAVVGDLAIEMPPHPPFAGIRDEVKGP